ncbi:hypothetical protein L6R52_31590, partial [Myxococcota bacterium]|nr:hypothetical protein [Myxococcota bacterium]
MERCVPAPEELGASDASGASPDVHEVFVPAPMERALAEHPRAPSDRLVAPDGASTREVALIEDLEALRARGASDWDVLARLSKEEPRTLQILYRTPGAQPWILAIASHARLVDVVERIGGPLDAQLSWLRAAGVRAAPRDARRSAAKDAGAELARDVERFAAVLSAEAAVERATRDHLSAGGGGVLAAGTFETGRRVITAESARSAALRDAGLTPSTWDSARADAIAKFQAR